MAITKDILAVIKVLAPVNDILQGLDKFLSDSLTSQIISKGFPIKIQLVLNMALRVNLSFKKVTLLSPEGLDSSHFDIPDS
jgi:hypothetical protein